MEELELLREGKVTKVYWDEKNKTWVLTSDTLGNTYHMKNKARLNEVFADSERRFKKKNNLKSYEKNKNGV